MGIFASFSKGFNAGKERAENQSYRRNDLLDCPVELVEPSVGNVVEFKVTEKKEFYAQTYMRQIITYAKCLERLARPSGKLKVKMFALYFKMKRMRE